MNNLERFKAIVHFQEPDYYPIFGFPGAPGMSRGCQTPAHQRLVQGGMPAHIGGEYRADAVWTDPESWCRYWGTTDPVTLDFSLARDVQGFAEKRWTEGEFEYIESECGALTRQVIDNEAIYSMPEFITYPVRDRASWEFYRERMTPTAAMSRDEMEENCRRFDRRERPLMIGAGGTYGLVRGLLGPANVSYALYDDPDLIQEIIDWQLDKVRTYVFPLIERLRPEVVCMGEDLCYNHGMLLSPRQFDRFCGAYYREVCSFARAHGVDLVAVDSDGNIMEYVGLARSYGVNGFFPCEVKAGNDLFVLRERYPDIILFGWLEKECVNEGNEGMIRSEIMSKVPPLLAKRGYFPNGDHGIQPLITFENMCRFMTLLHEVTGNPEGEFPRMVV